MATVPEDKASLSARVVKAMYDRDATSQSFGMVVEEVSDERVVVSMLVRADMTQAVGTCHGGVIFTLADSAFAFACNRGNKTTVAAGGSIEFLKPGYEGDCLTATAVENVSAGRSGVYDIKVENQKDETIAVFRGKSREIGGAVVE